MFKFAVAIAVAVVALTGRAQALTTVSVEAPGALRTTASLYFAAVETFDVRPTDGSVATVNTNFPVIGVFGNFTGAQILPADQYTGAGGVGNGVAVRNTGDLDITLTGRPLNYFGVWASALDGANTVTFYKGARQIDSINLTAFPLSAAYAGNPSGPFAGQNSSEKYAFFNIAVSGGYDRAVLSQNGGGGFELDNITVGTTVPEPASWALMVAGFGLVGIAQRRRKVSVAA